MFELSSSSLSLWLSDWFRARWRELRGQNIGPIPFDVALEAAPYFLDSLELLTLASHAADDFGVRDAGIEDYFLAHRTLSGWAELIRQSWTRSPDPAISFSTSGSTGTPVRHRHRLALLVQEIQAFDSLLPPSPIIRKSVPAHHIYGFLFTVLLAQHRGAEVVSVEPESPQWNAGELLVTHPVHLGLWKRRGLTLPRGLTVLSSTSALSPELWQWLDEQGCRVFEIFGSSETAGIGHRSSGRDPFTVLSHWTLELTAGATRLARPGLEKPIEIPDHLERLSSTTFRPLGRRDQGVKIAGRLVYLEAVRRVLLTHPAVRDCALRTEDTEDGPRLSAFLVSDEGGPELEAALRTLAAERLETGARPQRYTFGSQLPPKIPGQPATW